MMIPNMTLIVILLLSFYSLVCCTYLDRDNLNDNDDLIKLNKTDSNKLCDKIGDGRQCNNDYLSEPNLTYKIDYVTDRLDAYLKSSSILYGLILTAIDTDGLNERCKGEMKHLYKAIQHKDVWAMKALDSSGNHQSGFLWGNNLWLGSIKGCETLSTPLHVTLSNRYYRNTKPNLITELSPFEFQYRMVHAQHASPWQVEIKLLAERILHIGLCLPKSCTNHEIMNLTQQYWDESNIGDFQLFEYKPEILNVKDLELSSEFFHKNSIKIVGGFILFTFIMIGLAFKYDIIPNDPNNNENGIKTDEMYSTIQSNKKMENVNVTTENVSQFRKIIKCFSIVDNFKSIVSTKTTSDSLPAINGIRSICCFWILSFHMPWFMHFSINNPAVVISYGEELRFLHISNAPVLVDLFFMISGFLLAYNFLRNTKKLHEIQTNSVKENFYDFMKRLLHRYLRLSPLYLVIVGITEIATSYMVETSPFWIHERYDQTCSKYWWRNVLYIQNIFNMDDICLNWTWSLACEMQFFIIFMVILYFYAKNPEKTKKFFIAFIAGLLAMVTLISYIKRFTPGFDVMYELATDLYIAPWSRIVPYGVGVGCGWILINYKTGSLNIKLEPKLMRNLWIISIALFGIIMHITLYRALPYYVSSPIMAAVRLLFGCAVGFMIIASATGYGGLFAKLMESRVFVHINKVSYAVYLVNPLVIAVIYSSRDQSTQVEPITMYVMTTGIMVFCYLIAIVFSLLFEVPYCKISSVLLRNQNKRQLKEN